jgi:glutamine---fructose-6-phosphate transaminase (isomerizing)
MALTLQYAIGIRLLLSCHFLWLFFVAACSFKFVSDTDTEVFAHLVASVRAKHPDMPLDMVVRTALLPVHGTFGLVFSFAEQPDLLIGCRRGSPLIVGVGEGEYFLASDASAVVEHTKQVEYLQENEMVVITRSGYVISTLDVEAPKARDPAIVKLEMSLEAIEKGGYKHFMLKEIMEQPNALLNAMRGRVNVDTGEIKLGGISGEPLKRMAKARRIIIAACGTSFHSGMVGEYAIETLARIPVEVEYASEFRYRKPILFPDDVLIVISQSGETADTLAAVREAKAHGVLTLGVVNSVGSSIARETDAGAYLHVGPEIGVASTKAFTGQVLILTMIALMLAKEKNLLTDAQAVTYAKALSSIPQQMKSVLNKEQNDRIKDLARVYKFASSFLYLGRGYNFPVALEGALKLKEISYIHAEGYAAAEMKHGPIALIDKFMPVVVIALPSDSTYDKVKSNIEEVLARGGYVIAVTEEGNHELDDKCEAVLHIPRSEEFLAPLLSVVPLQLLSYYIADMRKCNVDQPRNLAKSVTVE